jgi:hypothetical protein
MRFTVIVIFIFCICVVGHKGSGAIPEDTLNNNKNNLQGLDTSERFNGDYGLANNPRHGPDHYGNIISRIKNSYRGLVTRYRIDSHNLILLSIGIAGTIGIRRRIRKR